jgi:hypothetical protein
MFGFQVRLVFRWEWLTLLPDSSPLAQISQTLAMCYTSLTCGSNSLLTHNNGILAQKAGGCKYFYLTGVKNLAKNFAYRKSCGVFCKRSFYFDFILLKRIIYITM